jgi:xylan 1,4-beta-xylosidase
MKLLLLIILYISINVYSSEYTRDKLISFEAKINYNSNEEDTKSFPHTWKKSIGSGHAYLALRNDWQSHLKIVRNELDIEYVRFHGILDDEIFQLKRNSNTKELIYNFTLVDNIYDYITSIGMKPFVELSFMPTVLASGTATWMAYHANITPPKNMTEWSEMIKTFTNHLQNRYGQDEVSKWYFEIWNEPNTESRLDCVLPLPPKLCMGNGFWAGTQSQYFDFYAATASAIKKINNLYRVGGPSTGGGGWIEDFISFINSNNIPCDFISTHHYPSLEIPDTITKDVNNDAIAINHTLPLIISEFNTGLEGPIPGVKALINNDDSEYASSFLIRTIGRTVIKGADILSYWTFSDVFDEITLSTIPFHDGYGLLTMDSIRKPVYNAFKILSSAGVYLLPMTSSIDETSPCDVFATSNILSISNNTDTNMIITIYISNSQPIPNVKTLVNAPMCNGNISIYVSTILKLSDATITRIDKTHGNAYRVWKHEMDSPNILNEEQIEILNKASELSSDNTTLFSMSLNGIINGIVDVPAFGVAMIKLILNH